MGNGSPGGCGIVGGAARLVGLFVVGAAELVDLFVVGAAGLVDDDDVDGEDALDGATAG